MYEVTLNNIQSKSQFLETPEGKSLFGSANALDWFERVHKEELVMAGVLIKIRGRWLRIRPPYDHKIMEIAQAMAHKSIGVKP